MLYKNRTVNILGIHDIIMETEIRKKYNGRLNEIGRVVAVE